MTRLVPAGFYAAVTAIAIAGVAAAALESQTRPARADRTVQRPGEAADPRVGLAPGYRTAGVAARHMELVANVPRPRGFYDPASPAGYPTPPERKEEEAKTEQEDAAAAAKAAARPGLLDLANTDAAFQGDRVFAGNYSGVNTYDISDPRAPRHIASLLCPGGQGDVSVHGSLLFMSVEQTRGRIDCGAGGVGEPVSPERFRGVRIFDITDLARPRQVAAVQTCRGSHTHTLLVHPADREHVYVYASGTSAVRSAKELELSLIHI